MINLLVATRNQAKGKELVALLHGLPVQVLTLRDFPDAPEVVEDGDTLEANAAKKAIETAVFCRELAVADDSGLFVDALDGRPGVQSARYAGEGAGGAELCRKLLSEMADVADELRTAHFRCCIVMADPIGRIVLVAEGRCEGVIAREPQGKGGFGYDPVFYYPLAGCTFAQMAPEEKNAVSHRGCALAEFREKFLQFLRGADV